MLHGSISRKSPTVRNKAIKKIFNNVITIPKCVIALTNRDATHDIFRHIRSFFAHIFSYNVGPHAETNENHPAVGIILLKVDNHFMEIFCAPIAENPMRCQLDRLHSSYVIDSYTSEAFSLCMMYECANIY